MGAKVKNDGILWFRVDGRLYATSYSGLGLTREHRTGRYALDVAGLRRLHAGRPVGTDLSPAAGAVIEALAARYGWDEQPWPLPWGSTDVPALQTGVGMELDGDGEIVVLPVLGGPDRHECPEMSVALDKVAGIHQPGWMRWLNDRAAAEQAELRAVVEVLRGVLG